jgi:hypothetical protein
MRAGIASFEELIHRLEHIEVDELHSDIPANVSAELRHIKHNLSAILAFLGRQAHAEAAVEPERRAAIRAVRQECMSLHLTITKIQLFRFFRLQAVMESPVTAKAMEHYQRIGMAVCELCDAFAPQLTAQLGSAL